MTPLFAKEIVEFIGCLGADKIAEIRARFRIAAPGDRPAGTLEKLRLAREDVPKFHEALRKAAHEKKLSMATPAPKASPSSGAKLTIRQQFEALADREEQFKFFQTHKDALLHSNA